MLRSFGSFNNQNFKLLLRSMTTEIEKKFKFAAIQLSVGADKQENIDSATKLIKQAAKEGAKVVSLPECWNCPYGNSFFRKYAEIIPSGESVQHLSKLAKELDVVLIGGSIPEKDGDKIFNTSVAFDNEGKIVAQHRKMHLFDIDIPNGITFIESKTLSAGNQVTTFDTKYGTFGLAICYDMRFGSLAQLMAQRGASFLVYPGAFNTTTGPLHWELLIRARAVDNQLFVAAISPARDEKAGYQAWGHSTIVSPWGRILANTDHTESIVYADIDLNEVTAVRQQIPVTVQQRNDIYELQDKTKQ